MNAVSDIKASDNFRDSVHCLAMKGYVHSLRSSQVAIIAALLGLLPATAWGQDCAVDEDCGHGFQCIHDSAGTSSVTGSGGSSAAECGDGICDGASEDVDSCPDDCDTIQYCGPAECTSDDDCAEGYECGPEVGSNTATTGAGGSGSSECGDSICGIDESTDTCPEDCRVYRFCQVAQVPCKTDADCSDGLYCYHPGANSGSSAVSGSSGEQASGGSGGQAAGDEAGQCVPEETGENSASSTQGSETSTGGGGSGEANSSATGSNGVGGVSDSGNDSSATGNATGSSEGGSSGGGGDGGCSCSMPAQGKTPSALLLLGAVACVRTARRRRTTSGGAGNDRTATRRFAAFSDS